MDPSGSLLYVAENGNRRVSVFAAQSGHFLTKFGVGGAEGGGGLAIPAGLAVAPSGIIYVADLGPRQIRRFKLTMDVKQQPVGATELPAWGKPGIGSGEFLKPYALAIDTQGRVYVADSENDHCQVFSADGAFIAAFGDDIDKLTPLSPPSGLSARLPDSVCSSGGSYRVRIKPSKNPVPSNEMMGLQAEVLEGCGEGAKPAEGVRLHVNAGMPEHQHGMTTQPRVLPLEGGRWDVAGLLFHMPGYWELYFDMEREGVVERAQMEFKLE
jgi:hypothetical protein